MRSSILPRPRFLLVLVGLLLLVACAGEPPGTPTPTLAPTATLDPLMGMGEAAEAWQLLAQRGPGVWEGWGKELPPLLIRNGPDDFLVGHPAPPDGFAPAAGLEMDGQIVYRRSGHLIPVPAATAWNVAGVWSVAVPGRTEFQQAVDQALGAGKIKIDPPAYVRSIVHEAFHAYEFTLAGGNLPQFGADVDEPKMIQDLTARADLGERYNAEGLALANALRATTQPNILAETAGFLQLRRERRATLPPEVASYEQAVEWSEGLARYADTSLLRLAGLSDYQPLLPDFIYPAPDATWEQFLKALSEPAQSPDGFRGRYYLLGAGQAFLLDRLSPGWRQSALPGMQSLESLLQQAFNR